MSKINQIECALLEIEGGKFQKLCNAYLHKLGYERLNTIGSVLGSDKSKKGTPDTLITLENGKVNFAEFTTEQNYLAKKIRVDIDKCLNEKKTKIPKSDIKNIIFCHNSRLEPDEEQALYKYCREQDVNLQIFGIGTIAYALLQKYPGIAKDFLGIEIDTGQILDPEEFVAQVGKNQLTTPLDTTFYFREQELKEAASGLQDYSVVLVAGPAGVGKSRLALKILEDYKSIHPEFTLRCIHNKSLELYEDLKINFSEPGAQLVLIDDANRISQFDIILDILRNQREDQNLKFVITVRDYAKEKIESTIRTIGEYTQLDLLPLEDSQISELVKGLYDINNQSYLERITRISAGNPRLAIMAARVAVKHNTLESISDVTTLYDEYFSSITGDLKNLENPDVLKVAGIISLLRSIDKSNQFSMNLILSTFGLSPEVFWGAAKDLHNCEVVDIYENEVVKISDQVYATYLFYLTFLKENVLDVNVLFEDAFLYEQANRIRDAVYPCFDAFNFKAIADILRPLVQSAWKNVTEAGDQKKIHELIGVFWFLIQTDVLLYASNEIKRLEPNAEDINQLDWELRNVSFSDHPLLGILSKFGQLKDPAVAITSIDLAMEYAEKRQEALPHLVHMLFEYYGFDTESYRYGYHVPRAVIRHLWSKTENGSHEIFLGYSLLWLRNICESNMKSMNPAGCNLYSRNSISPTVMK